METAVTGGGGGFCTLVGLAPPHPVRIAIITAERSKRMLLLIATASLLSCLIMICDGNGDPDRYFSNEENWSRMFSKL
jgi:hypothetical protein